MSLIIDKYGWRVLLRIMGALLLFVGVPCALLFVDPPQPAKDYTQLQKQGEKTGDDMDLDAKIVRVENASKEIPKSKSSETKLSVSNGNCLQRSCEEHAEKTGDLQNSTKVSPTSSPECNNTCSLDSTRRTLKVSNGGYSSISNKAQSPKTENEIDRDEQCVLLEDSSEVGPKSTNECNNTCSDSETDQSDSLDDRGIKSSIECNSACPSSETKQTVSNTDCCLHHELVNGKSEVVFVQKEEEKGKDDEHVNGPEHLQEVASEVRNHSMLRKIGSAFSCPEVWLISTALLLNGIGDCFPYLSLVRTMSFKRWS